MNVDKKALCPRGHEMYHKSGNCCTYDPSTRTHQKYYAWYFCECGWCAPIAYGKTRQEAIEAAYVAATRHPESTNEDHHERNILNPEEQAAVAEINSDLSDHLKRRIDGKNSHRYLFDVRAVCKVLQACERLIADLERERKGNSA